MTAKSFVFKKEETETDEGQTSKKHWTGETEWVPAAVIDFADAKSGR
jgi:hypothetical protein